MGINFSDENYCMSCKGDGCLDSTPCVLYIYQDWSPITIYFNSCENCEFKCEICNGSGSISWIDILVKKIKKEK